ncbi:hypothetical protein P7C73_g2962, partial [Tremellales sp. Uapishka_1]
MDLGAPIGTNAQFTPEGEHGRGTGLSGGYSSVNAQNSQSGALAAERDASYAEGGDFNSGVGGGHASGGLPIAEKYTSGYAGNDNQYSGNNKLDNALDSNTRSGGYSSGDYSSSGQAVSGQYAGTGTQDALGGQSNARTTGDGVGYNGENLDSYSSSTNNNNAGSYALGGAALGGAAGYGGASDFSTKPLVKEQGLPAGEAGAGGRDYETAGSGLSRGEGENYGKSGDNYDQSGNQGGNSGSTAKGHYGTVDNDETRGQPISNPKEIDSGGPHSLVWNGEKYVHRRDL